MVSIDINCDMGEGMATDEAIMPYIGSANIACGYHAGDADTMKRTIELCLKYNVAIGAHPSFFDRENFGRHEMDIAESEMYDLITQQLFIINEIADTFDATISHVKPHGALYNMSAKNKTIAKTIAHTVKDFNKELVLFGLSGSHSISEAKAAGLKTANEVFADRTYQDDGSLTPRKEPNALIEDAVRAAGQVLQMIKEKTITSGTRKKIAILADTICIHGDGKHAVEFAKIISENLKKNNIVIKAL
ncbi:MAG: 5-oxoprolinase subunit PxpA [Chitinophagaceae bacterium]